MNAPLAPVLLASCLALALAGCVGDTGHNAKLSYDGDGIGTHDDSTTCDSDAHLLGSGNIQEGSVRVTVTTEDRERYSKDFTGSFTLASQELTGESGRWRLTATRVGGDNIGLSGFDGDYSFTMTC